uniref:ELM2 domain-containing protein n=1 Tax=Panagrolaimus sp. JU765 TaxID=591449 RepID=A0AC34Q449_9BILA
MPVPLLCGDMIQMRKAQALLMERNARRLQKQPLAKKMIVKVDDIQKGTRNLYPVRKAAEEAAKLIHPLSDSSSDYIASEPWVVDAKVDTKKTQTEDTLIQVFCNADVQFRIPKEKVAKKAKPVKNQNKRIIIEKNKPEDMLPPKILPEGSRKLARPKKKISPKASEKDVSTRKRRRPLIDDEDEVREREPRKRKAEVLPTDDPNAPAPRRSARQRYRPTLYMSNTDDEKTENEEDEDEKHEKYELCAAPVPSIVSLHSELENRELDELVIDPVKTTTLDENEVQKYLAMIKADFGADSHMAMVHLANCDYNIKKAMETADEEDSKLMKLITAASWKPADVVTLKKSMSARKNHKSMIHIARKIPSKNVVDVVAAYYWLKKSVCNLGKGFQICNRLLQNDQLEFNFDYSKKEGCENCVKQLWKENSKENVDVKLLCSLCADYFLKNDCHRPNSKVISPVFDFSMIEHKNCRLDKLKDHFDECKIENVQQLVGFFPYFRFYAYCVRGNDLPLLEEKLKDQKISKMTKMVLQNSEKMNEIHIFVSSKPFHKIIPEFKSYHSEFFMFESNSEISQLNIGKDESKFFHEQELYATSTKSGYYIDPSIVNIKQSTPQQSRRNSIIPNKNINMDIPLIKIDNPELIGKEKEESPDINLSLSEREGTSPDSDNSVIGTKVDESTISNSTESSVVPDDDDLEPYMVYNEHGKLFKVLENNIEEVSNDKTMIEENDGFDLDYFGQHLDDSIKNKFGWSFYEVYEHKMYQEKIYRLVDAAEIEPKIKLIEGKTPEEWLKEHPLKVSCTQFVDDFRSCKKKLSTLAEKYKVPVAVVKSFYTIHNVDGGLQRMFFTADQKQKSRRGRKSQKQNKKRKTSLKTEEYNLDSEIQKMYEDAVESFDENALLVVSF